MVPAFAPQGSPRPQQPPSQGRPPCTLCWGPGSPCSPPTHLLWVGWSWPCRLTLSRRDGEPPSCPPLQTFLQYTGARCSGSGRAEDSHLNHGPGAGGNREGSVAWLLLLLSPGRGRDPLPEEPSSRAWRKGQRAQKHLGKQAWPRPPAHEHLTALCAAAPRGHRLLRQAQPWLPALSPGPLSWETRPVSASLWSVCPVAGASAMT